MTLPGGTPTFYHATNSDRDHPARGTWSYEMRGAGNQWDILQSESLLVLLKLETLHPWGAHASIGELLEIFKSEPIPPEGQNPKEGGEWFDCRTWTRRVIERLFAKELSPVAGQGKDNYLSPPPRYFCNRSILISIQWRWIRDPRLRDSTGRTSRRWGRLRKWDGSELLNSFRSRGN